MKAVISYAHCDSSMLERLHKHLAMLRRDSGLAEWYDRDILAGDLIDGEIHHHIESCDLFIVLVSPDFLASNYCYEKEMKQAIVLHDAKRLRIVPIILEPCDWRASPLRQFKALPRDGKPISEWSNENAAFLDVVTELRRVIASRAQPLASAVADDVKTIDIVSSPKYEARAAHRVQLPLLPFTREIDRFMSNSAIREEWVSLDPNTKRLLSTVGTKLEPIVQIAPVTPAPVVLGFELLALGPLGENFNEIVDACAGFNPGALRICLSIAALKTINYLRDYAEPANVMGAGDLKFSLNLDPVMLDSPLLKQFLHQYRLTIQHNVIFEINEKTSAQYLTQLKNLQVDFKLRFSADDVNAWDETVKREMIPRVEMTKMDHPSFRKAMLGRGDDLRATIKSIRANAVRGKPIVVEGVDNDDYLQFLRRHWDAKKYGVLYGQGYHLGPGIYWDGEVLSLKGYGLPGGNMLRKKSHESDDGAWSAMDDRGPNSPRVTPQ